MTYRSRPYHGTEDDARVRQLFVESYAITGRWHCWTIEHQELMRYGQHAEATAAGDTSWEQHYRVWETESGQLVGVVIPESGNDIYLQVHPHHRAIEPEMFDWLEEHFASHRPAWWGERPVRIFCSEQDTFRQELLAQRGWTNRGPAWNFRRCSLEGPLPEPRFPEGYYVQGYTPGDRDFQEKRCTASNATWGGDGQPDMATFHERSPIYRADWDLAVVAPDGSHAAFCILWLDAVNRTVVFEPVGTHPDHRGKGLAKAMMWHGLHLAAEAGARLAFVTSWAGSEGANALYQSAGFDIFDRDFAWEKHL